MSDPERNEARRALMVGGGLAIAVFAVPFLRFVFHTLITLVHELGHALAAWAFGIPSIPAFDFVYGGGVTIHQGRSTGLIVLVYLVFLGLAYRVRDNRGLLIAFSVWVCAYTLAAFTPVHEAIVFVFLIAVVLVPFAAYMASTSQRSSGGFSLRNEAHNSKS